MKEQRVSIDDIGSVSEIEEHANYYGANIKKLKLTSQFRCNGSDSISNWIDDVLEIDETGNFRWIQFDYDIRNKG